MSYLNSLPAKIIVLGDGSLLDEGISNMLTLNSSFSVSRIRYTNDDVLYDLVNLEHPNAVFIAEFGALDISHTINRIFSIPSTFIKYVVVVHAEHSRFDVYENTAATYTPIPTYQMRSMAINTKDELINFALEVAHLA
jgi:hypothetical protein